MRVYELATATVFVLIGAVAMFESRRGALLGATRDPGGIGSGFYPFWSAAVLAVAGLLLIYQITTRPESVQGVVVSRQGLIAVGRLVVPMLLLVVAMPWFGFYLSVGLYMAWFARRLGGYRWPWVAASAIGVPLLVYFIFELGFRMLLPKSVLYGYLLPI